MKGRGVAVLSRIYGGYYSKQQRRVLLFGLWGSLLLNVLTRPKKHSRGPKPKGVPNQGYRPDIQGLRALAVLLVIADHLFGWPHGGFIGVDVFFVLSGFLITGLLIREHEKRGRISFANFYRRRARRILPLSALVLLVTVGISWAIFNSGRAMQITEDGVWSLFFGMNWHLAIIGTDYMQADGAVSPLQHFWSLAVEEQFYVVWPLLIVLVLGTIAARLRWSGQQAARLLVVLMTVVSLASFAFAMWETTASPTFAYFSTFSRAWELGAGALLAAAVPAMRRIPDAIRPALAYAGLAGIVCGALFINPELPFPAPWALLPVISTVLVLAAGCGGQHAGLQPLTNPVSRYLGDISYSLYLWHFPIIILAGALTPIDSPSLYATVLAATLGLSALSYYFLEEPIRTSNWLEPKKNRKGSSSDTLTRLRYGGVVALTLIALTTSAAALARTGTSDAVYTAPLPASTLAQDDEATTSPELAALQTNIQAALSAPEWPALSPAVEELGPSSKAQEWVEDGCLAQEQNSLDDPVENAERCTYGDPNAENTAVLLGDSVGISYLPTIRAALEPQGYNIRVFTMQQCPWVSISVIQGSGAPHESCDSFREWAYEEIRQSQPEAVFLSSAARPNLASEASGSEYQAQWKEAAEATFNGLTGVTGRIVVLPAPPPGESLTTCATRVSVPSDCETQEDDSAKSQLALNQQAANRVSDQVPVDFINTTQWFCGTGSRCPAFVADTPVLADGVHLTGQYAGSLGPVLAEALAQQAEQ